MKTQKIIPPPSPHPRPPKIGGISSGQILLQVEITGWVFVGDESALAG
jgi:hypothetical protein